MHYLHKRNISALNKNKELAWLLRQSGIFPRVLKNKKKIKKIKISVQAKLKEKKKKDFKWWF